MLSAHQETFIASEFEVRANPKSLATIEGKITHHPAWKKLQKNLHLYATPSNQPKSELLPELTHSLNSLFKLLYHLVEFNAMLQAVTSHRFEGNTIERAEIVSDQLMVLEALTVFGHHPSELADLPGQTGLYIAMDHAVVINQYTNSRSIISEQCAVTKLKPARCTTLATRQALAFEPQWGNIVEMQSVGAKSILLCARYQYDNPQTKYQPRYTYQPITANRETQASFFARREESHSEIIT